MLELTDLRRAILCALFFVGVSAHSAGPAAAAVPNVAVCTAPSLQMPPAGVPNGAGGALIVWADLRWGALDVYIQQTNSLGLPVWTDDGIPVCKVSGSQQFPRVAADGTGGAIVVWQDQRGADQDIYAQRVSSTGAVVWANGGIPICSATGTQERPEIVPDGAGGAVIVWVDQRGATQDVYAQRLDASGNLLWEPNGVALSTASGSQSELSVISDGWGGAIVAWKDTRGVDADVFVQRVNSSGAPQWLADGVPVTAGFGVQQSPVLVTDGAFGAIAAWADLRGGNWDVYAQRLDSSGVPQWIANGVAVSAATGDQTAPRLCADGASGAIVAWEDRRGADSDIYAQRMTSTGAASWTADGNPVCSAAADQTAPSITFDDAGGAVISWADLRTAANGSDIYAQRVSGAGAVAWTANGVALCDTLETQDAVVAVSDGEGGTIATWRDARAGSSTTDVFAQRVDGGGLVLGQCPAATTQLLANSVTTTSSVLHYYDVPVPATVGWSGVGIRSASGTDWDVEFYPQLTYGLAPYPICFANPMAASSGSGGVDFVAVSFESNRTPANTTYGARASRYSGTGPGTVEWDLLEQSLSNNCTGSCSGTSVNNWSGVLNVYDVRLIQGTTYTFEFTPSGPGLKLLLFTSSGLAGPYVAGRPDAVFETASRYVYTAPVTEWYGVVVVNDSGLSGAYNIKVRPGATVGVGDAPMSEAGIMGVSPNPARGKATIRFALTEPGEVSFRVLDMAGRVVAKVPAQRWEAGTWTLPWDGTASDGRALAAGVYFVQMELDGRRLGQQRLALVR